MSRPPPNDPPGCAGAVDILVGVGTPAEPEVPPAAPRGRRGDDDPVLPGSTRDDTDAGWGERPVDRAAWLRDERPPHWD
jgi:hypothetical protein